MFDIVIPLYNKERFIGATLSLSSRKPTKSGACSLSMTGLGTKDR